MQRRKFLGTLGLSLGWMAGGRPWSMSACRAEERRVAIRRGLPTELEIRSRSGDLWKLVDLINRYRGRYGLPAVPLSPRLTAVAALHVKDLVQSRPHEAYGSLHSWSPNDHWTGGDYKADDPATWSIMWDKPKEITGYSGLGFEISAAGVRDLAHALKVWALSPPHNNVMLNRDVWQSDRWQWQALGAVFYQGFACAWFGDRPDG